MSRRPGGGPSTEGPQFVIQKHDASTLHCDFRIEADGVRGDDAQWLLVKVDDEGADRRRTR